MCCCCQGQRTLGAEDGPCCCCCQGQGLCAGVQCVLFVPRAALPPPPWTVPLCNVQSSSLLSATRYGGRVLGKTCRQLRPPTRCRPRRRTTRARPGPPRPPPPPGRGSPAVRHPRRLSRRRERRAEQSGAEQSRAKQAEQTEEAQKTKRCKLAGGGAGEAVADEGAGAATRTQGARGGRRLQMEAQRGALGGGLTRSGSVASIQAATRPRRSISASASLPTTTLVVNNTCCEQHLLC